MTWERYECKRKLKKRAFTISRTGNTFVNKLVIKNWAAIDILYDKKNKLIGVKEGETLNCKKCGDRTTIYLGGFCRHFDVPVGPWVFSHTEGVMDIYKQKDLKEEWMGDYDDIGYLIIQTLANNLDKPKWADEFIEWYKPKDWFGSHRAVAAFLTEKFKDNLCKK